MNPIKLLLVEIVYRPIFNLLIVFLGIFQWNMWIAIIALTLTIRLLLIKTSIAQNDMQKQMTDIQPKLHEIQEKYKNDPQKLSEETMKILKVHWGGPLKWCIMMLVQIPVFFWLFYVIRDFSNKALSTLVNESLYSFFSFIPQNILNINNINHIFLWMDLLASKNIILWIITAILIFIQMKITMLNKPATPQVQAPWMPAMPDMNKMMWFMNIMMVVMMFSFVYSMPSWIWIYMITTTLFTIIQSGIQYKELIKIKLAIFFSKK